VLSRCFRRWQWRQSRATGQNPFVRAGERESVKGVQLEPLERRLGHGWLRCEPDLEDMLRDAIPGDGVPNLAHRHALSGELQQLGQRFLWSAPR